ncbi:MAG: hypothetical protein MMC23_000387 [Stictis urceolatum]|nr:hypothetical protein [Stictis urceolata]
MMLFLQVLIVLYAQVGAFKFGCCRWDFKLEETLAEIGTVNLAIQKTCGMDAWESMYDEGIMNFTKHVERRNRILESDPLNTIIRESITSKSDGNKAKNRASSSYDNEAANEVFKVVPSTISEADNCAAVDDGAIERIQKATNSKVGINTTSPHPQVQSLEREQEQPRHRGRRMRPTSNPHPLRIDQEENPILAMINKNMNTIYSPPPPPDDLVARLNSPIRQMMAEIRDKQKEFRTNQGPGAEKLKLLLNLPEERYDDPELVNNQLSFLFDTSVSFWRIYFWVCYCKHSLQALTDFAHKKRTGLGMLDEVDRNECIQSLPDDPLAIVERILVLYCTDNNRYKYPIELSDEERFRRFLANRVSVDELRKIEHDIHIFDIRNPKAAYTHLSADKAAAEKKVMEKGYGQDDDSSEDEIESNMVTNFNPTEEAGERKGRLSAAIELAKGYAGYPGPEEPPARPFHNGPVVPKDPNESKNDHPKAEDEERIYWEVADQPASKQALKKTYQAYRPGVIRVQDFAQERLPSDTKSYGRYRHPQRSEPDGAAPQGGSIPQVNRHNSFNSSDISETYESSHTYQRRLMSRGAAGTSDSSQQGMFGGRRDSDPIVADYHGPRPRQYLNADGTLRISGTSSQGSLLIPSYLEPTTGETREEISDRANLLPAETRNAFRTSDEFSPRAPWTKPAARRTSIEPSGVFSSCAWETPDDVRALSQPRTTRSKASQSTMTWDGQRLGDANGLLGLLPYEQAAGGLGLSFPAENHGSSTLPRPQLKVANPSTITYEPDKAKSETQQRNVSSEGLTGHESKKGIKLSQAEEEE